MELSPPVSVYRSPVESGRESGRVWGVVSRAKLGGPLEDRTIHLLRNSHIYHPSKFQLDPTVQTPGTFRLVHHFSDLFFARERIRPEFIFFMNGISDILFLGSFVWGIVFCSQTHPTNFKVFSNMIFTLVPVSNQPDNVAPWRPTCARHVVALLSRAQLLRIIISASRTIVRHREG